MLILRHLGLSPYANTLARMQAFTATRGSDACDELWLLEHPPVFTLGQAGRREHVHDAGETPLIASDRGGQVTFHGPGQVVIYALIDLTRRSMGVRGFVSLLEQSVMDVLAVIGIAASRRRGAPGVYVDDAKIAALGLRVRRGCSYHGVAVNVTVDLEPFTRIDPCGHAGLRVTRVCDLVRGVGVPMVGALLLQALASALGDAVDEDATTPEPPTDWMDFG